MPEFRSSQNGGGSSSLFDPSLSISAPPLPLSIPRSSFSASQNSSLSPNSTGGRRIPHDIAKEGDNYLAPEEMPLSVWIEIEIHQVEDPENVFFQGDIRFSL